MSSTLIHSPITTHRSSPLAKQFLKGELHRPAAIAGALVSGLIGVAVMTHALSVKPFWPAFYGTTLAIHILTVTPALPMGAWLLFSAKGTKQHRLLGRVWVVLMLATAITSFGISQLTGTFSPIHLLSLLTIFSILRGIWFIRSGDIARHQRSMVLAFTGLIVAAAFALMPGRLLGTWLIG